MLLKIKKSFLSVMPIYKVYDENKNHLYTIKTSKYYLFANIYDHNNQLVAEVKSNQDTLQAVFDIYIHKEHCGEMAYEYNLLNQVESQWKLKVHKIVDDQGNTIASLYHKEITVKEDQNALAVLALYAADFIKTGYIKSRHTNDYRF